MSSFLVKIKCIAKPSGFILAIENAEIQLCSFLTFSSAKSFGRIILKGSLSLNFPFLHYIKIKINLFLIIF